MSWQSLLGHDAIAASFAAALKLGRLAHAYLFAGQRGVGKHTFAVELAKTLLCENRSDRFLSCGRCAACLLVAAGTHPDLFRVKRPEEGLEFPIAVIKEEVLPALAMKPARGSRKVVILDDAEDLNEEAANSFLKTLEEPPSGSLLILIGGANAESQLPTILSRCQVVRFSPLAPAMMRTLLVAKGITDPVRQDRLLQLAAGSPGQALELDDEAIWAFRTRLLDTLSLAKLDSVAMAAEWMEFIDSAGKDGATQRPRAALIVRMFTTIIDSALKLSLGAAISGIDPGEERQFREIADRLGEQKMLAWLERALAADRQIERRVQLVLVIEAFADALGQSTV